MGSVHLGCPRRFMMMPECQAVCNSCSEHVLANDGSGATERLPRRRAGIAILGLQAAEGAASDALVSLWGPHLDDTSKAIECRNATHKNSMTAASAASGAARGHDRAAEVKWSVCE